MEMSIGGLNLHNVELHHVAGAVSQHIKNGNVQIAFSGRSNVGKSSLVNNLMGRKKLARVSSEPGKTITVNYYLVDKKLYLVDLPGYGFARRPKQDQERWSRMTQSYFDDNEALTLVLQLVDIKVGLTEDDMMMLDFMDHYEIPYIIVATKCDKLNKTQLTAAVNDLLNSGALRAGTEIILYSSTKGIGRGELWKRIAGAYQNKLKNSGSDE
jgi:GTP-binding protein